MKPDLIALLGQECTDNEWQCEHCRSVRANKSDILAALKERDTLREVIQLAQINCEKIITEHERRPESPLLNIWALNLIEAIVFNASQIEPSSTVEGWKTLSRISELEAENARLREKLRKVADWLERLAAQCDSRITGRWLSLDDANKADAKNYRATAKDMLSCLEKPSSTVEGGTK